VAPEDALPVGCGAESSPAQPAESDIHIVQTAVIGGEIGDLLGGDLQQYPPRQSGTPVVGRRC
jgi:hypothetical protein